MHKNKFREIADSLIEKARQDLEVELNPDDPTLAEQLMLGDRWNDPAVVTNAVDQHPMFYARWNTLYKHLKRELKVASEMYDVWESSKREIIAAKMFSKNVDSGMTPNNAKPTTAQVNDKFNRLYKTIDSKGYEQYVAKHKRVEELEIQIDIADVVVKAFEHRKDMMLSFMSFIKFQYENNLVRINKTATKNNGKTKTRSL